MRVTADPSPIRRPGIVARILGTVLVMTVPRFASPASAFDTKPPLLIRRSIRAKKRGERSGRRLAEGRRRHPHDDLGDLVGVEDLALEQGPGQQIELLDLLLEQTTGLLRAVHHDPLNLPVDEDGGLLAVVLVAGGGTRRGRTRLP